MPPLPSAHNLRLEKAMAWAWKPGNMLKLWWQIRCALVYDECSASCHWCDRARERHTDHRCDLARQRHKLVLGVRSAAGGGLRGDVLAASQIRAADREMRMIDW